MFQFFIILLTFFAPSQAFAFSFGFVRGPDWMDPYLVFLVVLTAIALGFTLMFKPRGVPFNQMYQHFGNFSLAGRVAYATFGVSFTILMIMVFAGMGLQRATEAGF